MLWDVWALSKFLLQHHTFIPLGVRNVVIPVLLAKAICGNFSQLYQGHVPFLEQPASIISQCGEYRHFHFALDGTLLKDCKTCKNSWDYLASLQWYRGFSSASLHGHTFFTAAWTISTKAFRSLSPLQAFQMHTIKIDNECFYLPSFSTPHSIFMKMH